jgi:hypothetical protein
MNSSKYYFEKCKQISSKDLGLPEKARDFSNLAKHDVLVSKNVTTQKQDFDRSNIQELLKEGNLLFPSEN